MRKGGVFGRASLLIAMMVVWSVVSAQADEPKSTPSLTLGELLDMSPDELARVDLAEKYVLCAKGLPQTTADPEKSLLAIKKWAAELREHPHNGDEHQKASALVDAVKNGQRSNRVPISIHVVYVELGRQLGYPVHLASAGSAPCVRWEDGKTSFEVRGLRWNELLADNLQFVEKEPLRIEVPDEPAESSTSTGVWVLNPRDELSIFLSLRAQRFEEAGMDAEALVAFSQAHRLSPECTDHLYGILRVAKRITPYVNYTMPVHFPDGRENAVDDLNSINRMNAFNKEKFELERIKIELVMEYNRRVTRRQ